MWGLGRHGPQKLSTTISPRYYGVVTLVSILQVGESGVWLSREWIMWLGQTGAVSDFQAPH